MENKIDSKGIVYGIGAFLMLVLISVSTYFGAKDSVGLGSVAIGGEYTSTTTVSTSAGTHWVARSVTGGSSCTLGSIVVASSSGTTLTLWNATSTTDISSTTLTTLKAGIGEGTYTYDIDCGGRGLIVDTPAGFNGSYTVTFR